MRVYCRCCENSVSHKGSEVLLAFILKEVVNIEGQKEEKLYRDLGLPGIEHNHHVLLYYLLKLGYNLGPQRYQVAEDAEDN